MNIVLDASSIINLVNGSAFNTILNISGCQFFIGPQSAEECGDEAGQVLTSAIERNTVTMINDDDIPAADFIALLEEHGLGSGETECLMFCKLLGLSICSDDRQARNVAKRTLGRDRVTGSLGLLRRVVQAHSLTASDAFSIYQRMKLQGGFLPIVDVSFFSKQPLQHK